MLLIVCQLIDQSGQQPEFNTINWRDTTHFDSEDNYRKGCQNVGHCQQQQTTVLFRTTITRTIILNLLIKWLLGSNLSQLYKKQVISSLLIISNHVLT